MGLGARLRLDGRPAPSLRATVNSIIVLGLAPIGFVWVYLWLALNTRPPGIAIVRLVSQTVGETARATGLPDQAVSYGTTVDVEMPGGPISVKYYLVYDLAYGVVLIALVLAALVATAILLRRPFSRVVAAALVLFSAYAVYAAFAGPSARQWAVDRTILDADVPTSEAQAKTAGVDLYVTNDVGEWTTEWHGAFIALAIVLLAAALYVLHARRQTAVTGPTRRDL